VQNGDGWHNAEHFSPSVIMSSSLAAVVTAVHPTLWASGKMLEKEKEEKK
jgi:hypothetical protein